MSKIRNAIHSKQRKCQNSFKSWIFMVTSYFITWYKVSIFLISIYKIEGNCPRKLRNFSPKNIWELYFFRASSSPSGYQDGKWPINSFCLADCWKRFPSTFNGGARRHSPYGTFSARRSSQRCCTLWEFDLRFSIESFSAAVIFCDYSGVK